MSATAHSTESNLVISAALLSYGPKWEGEVLHPV